MFCELNGIWVNLLTASYARIEPDEICLNFPTIMLAGNSNNGETWEYDHIIVYRSHPKFLTLLKWIENNTL